MSDFNIPPISTLSGSRLKIFLAAIKTGRVEPKYYHKVLFSGLISAISTPFHLWDDFKDKNLPDVHDDPIFILGHWRSGTTFLHNILCQAPDAAYVTTYQSVFPNNMHSKWVFKSFMKWKIPDKRPSDNIALAANFPQEEEFTMGNLLSPAAYYFFYFPEHYKMFFDSCVLFNDRSLDELALWQTTYKKLLAKAMVNTSGHQCIIKNPINTGRIDILLKTFPKAKFLHIYRNPVAVYLSTKKFFLSLIPTLQLQDTSEEQIRDMIFDLYAMLMREYFAKKVRIPKGQLIELDYETFENKPLECVENLYSTLKLTDWETNKPYFEKYIATQTSYKKNSYDISREELRRIEEEWAFAFERFGYQVPSDIKII